MRLKKIISSIIICFVCLFFGSCSDNSQNYQGNQGYNPIQQNRITLTLNNFHSYATIDAYPKRLDRNTVYFDNYLIFNDNVTGYIDLKVSVKITYNVSYTLSNGKSYSDTRTAMVSFINNNKYHSSVYFSMSSTIVQINNVSTRFSLVKASGTLCFD